MKNVCKVVLNSDDIIVKAGLDPEEAVITNITRSEFDGRIEITIRSAVAVEGVTVESKYGDVRAKKLEFKSDVNMEEFLSKLKNTIDGMGIKFK